MFHSSEGKPKCFMKLHLPATLYWMTVMTQSTTSSSLQSKIALRALCWIIQHCYNYTSFFHRCLLLCSCFFFVFRWLSVRYFRLGKWLTYFQCLLVDTHISWNDSSAIFLLRIHNFFPHLLALKKIHFFAFFVFHKGRILWKSSDIALFSKMVHFNNFCRGMKVQVH